MRNRGNESGAGGSDKETQSCETTKIEERRRKKELVFDFNSEKRGRQQGEVIDPGIKRIQNRGTEKKRKISCIKSLRPGPPL